MIEDPADFSSERQVLIDRLADILGLTELPVDPSWEDLREIDRLLGQKGHKQFLQKSYFLPLLTYCGEVLRTRVNGSWRLRRDPGTAVWEPYIVNPEGRYYSFWQSVVDVCFDEGLLGVDEHLYILFEGGGYSPDEGFWADAFPASVPSLPERHVTIPDPGWEGVQSDGHESWCHILKGAIEDPEAFLRDIPGLLQQLANILGMDPEALDGSFASLGAVESRVWSDRPDRFLEFDHFIPLVAFVGEVIRREVGGDWRLRYDPLNDVWEPYVVDSAGRSYNPWLQPYKSLLEGDPQGALWAAIWAEIFMRRGVPPDDGGT